jgi:hypothetical protein
MTDSAFVVLSINCKEMRVEAIAIFQQRNSNEMEPVVKFKLRRSNQSLDIL